MKKEQVVEAVLFAAGNRMSITRIAELSQLSEKKTEQALHKLQEKYKGSDTPFEILHMDDDWKFTVKRAFIPLVEQIAPDTELPKPIVETLAVLAWKAPVLQSDLIKMRGTNAYEHIGELLDRGFITKEKAGRSYKVNLTPKFFEYFDVDKEAIAAQFAEFEGKEKVDEKKVEELMKRADEKREAELAALDEKPSLDEIKEEEMRDQEEFFDAIEKDMDAVTKRSDVIIGEMKDISPLPQEANPTKSEDGDSLDEIAESEDVEETKTDSAKAENKQ